MTIVMPRPWRGARLLVAALAVMVIAVVAIAVTAALDDGSSPTLTVRGSGHAVTEQRAVAPFTSVELAGTNAVIVRVGSPRSVAVTGDDNLVGRITTNVRADRLVVDDAGSFTTKAPMRVAVSVPSLDGVELSGTGSVVVHGVAAHAFAVTLSGTGTLDLHQLVARDVIARLDGTGAIRVHATSTLDATLAGTGSIRYSGGPAVTSRKTGTGSIVAE